MNTILKIILSCIILIFITSCNRKINQNSMFSDRSHKTKKKGIYDAGMKSKKPISVQLKKEYDKMSKYDTKPEKAKKKAEKELQKKKKAAVKARAKNNKKRHIKIKTTKTKTTGEQ